MNHQLPNTIDAILDQMYQHDEDTPAQQDESQPRRTLNVYIEVEEQDDDDSQALPPPVEGTLEKDATNNSTVPLPDAEQTAPPPAPLPTMEPHKTVPPVQATRHSSMRSRLIVLIAVLVAVLAALIGLNTSVVLSPLCAPSATVTLTTTSQQLTTTRMGLSPSTIVPHTHRPYQQERSLSVPMECRLSPMLT